MKTLVGYRRYRRFFEKNYIPRDQTSHIDWVKFSTNNGKYRKIMKYYRKQKKLPKFLRKPFKKKKRTHIPKLPSVVYL